MEFCLRFKMENWTTGNVVVLCYDGLRRWEMVNSYKIMNFEQTIIFLIICRLISRIVVGKIYLTSMFRIEYILRLLQWGIRRNLKPKTIEEKKWIKKKKKHVHFFEFFFFVEIFHMMSRLRMQGVPEIQGVTQSLRMIIYYLEGSGFIHEMCMSF